MDRKNRVWLIVLAILLVLAIAAVIVINGKLSTSRESLAAANTQLATQQESFDALNGEYESMGAELAGLQESSAGLETELAQAKEENAALETQLAAAETRATEAEARVATLETQLSDATSANDALQTQLSDATSANDALQTQLSDATSANDALQTQLTEATAAAASPANAGGVVDDRQAARTADANVTSDGQPIDAANVAPEEKAADTAPVGAATDAANVAPEGSAGNAIDTPQEGPATDATNVAPAGSAGNATNVTPEGPATDATNVAPEGSAGDAINMTPEGQPVATQLTREDLQGYAVEAESRIDALNAAIELAETSIVELGGEIKIDEADATATASDASFVITASGVQVPDVLNDATLARIGEICDEIDAIVNAEDGSMTAEEKIEALTALDLEMRGYVRELDSALVLIVGKEAELAATDDGIANLESELAQSQARVDELTASIEASQSTIQELEAQVAELTAQSETDNAQAAAQIEELNARIAAEEAKVDELTRQLAIANAELEARNAELAAYRLDRELVEGEAYTASTMGDVIRIAADGVHVEWSYTNDSISGNAVVLSILLDGEELYRSAQIQPGESVEGIALNRALSAGSYPAMAVMSVYDAEGAVVSATRVPVTIQVG